MDELVKYTEFLVKSICKEPELVKVSVLNNEDEETILEVLVPETEMGAVIGRAGKMASSLRTLILAYAYLNKLGRIKINFDSF